MRNFLRLVRATFRQRLYIVAIVFTSLMVGVLWGANLGVAYPLVKVALRGESLQSWLSEEVSASSTRIEQLEVESATANATAIQWEAVKQGWLGWAHQLSVDYLPADPFAALGVIVVALVLGTACKQVFLVSGFVFVGQAVHRTTRELREQFYSRALSMDQQSFGKDQSSDLISRLTHDVEQINLGLITVFGGFTREPAKAAACLVGAAMVSWQLLLICLAIAPIAGYLMVLLARSLKRSNRKAMQEMSQIYGKLANTLGGIETVQAYTMEQQESANFGASALLYARRSVRAILYAALTKPTTELMGVGILALAMLAGGYLVIFEQTQLFGLTVSATPLTADAMILFFLFLAGLSDPARKVSQLLSNVQKAAAGSDRVFEMFDREAKIVSPENPTPLPSGPLALEFENVTFAYNTEPILNNLSLSIEPGEVVALVGPNGCGKSTLLRLIPRFYDTAGGSVKISGVDVRDIGLEQLRRGIGWVAQKPVLFDHTIAANIAYGQPEATREEIIAAAKRAHADEFIQEKEDGYDTPLVESGRNVSGGQAQRIALARAILRDAPILLLDEATSQIDRRSESLIHETLADFITGRTVVMVTHRLSTLELADRIIVMDQGQIVDSGNHAELLSRCPQYRHLQQGQLAESA